LVCENKNGERRISKTKSESSLNGFIINLKYEMPVICPTGAN
jgi:hypothetical protein